MGDDSNIKNDAAAGVRVAYCLQYKLGGPNGMTIQTAGLVHLQFMCTKGHWSNLFTLASIMRPMMPGFSTEIASTPATQDHAASSSKAQEPILHMMQVNAVVCP